MITDRTEHQKKIRTQVKNVYSKNINISRVLDDESYLTLSHSTINGNDTFYDTIDISATPASI